jgi:DNA-directed RNA polymerase specialized sigma24 family protein
MEQPRQGWADAVLLARLRRGDSTALAEVYDAYAGLVHGLALRVLRDRTAAEEVTQQVFVTLWEAPNEYDGSRATLRAYLAALAHRRAVTAIRRGGGTGPGDAGDTVGTVGTPGDTTGTAGTAGAGGNTAPPRPGTERVRTAVERLPAAQRRALELTYFRGRTYRQVAEEMGVPESAAKSSLRLGLQGITESLRGEMSQQWV